MHRECWVGHLLDNGAFGDGEQEIGAQYEAGCGKKVRPPRNARIKRGSTTRVP